MDHSQRFLFGLEGFFVCVFVSCWQEMVKGIKQMYFWETSEIKVKSCILKDLVIVYSNVGKKNTKTSLCFIYTSTIITRSRTILDKLNGVFFKVLRTRNVSMSLKSRWNFCEFCPWVENLHKVQLARLMEQNTSRAFNSLVSNTNLILKFSFNRHRVLTSSL